MSYAFPHASIEPRSNRRRRSPAIVLVSIAAAGILADRNWAIPINGWLCLTAIAAIGWLCCLSFPVDSKRGNRQSGLPIKFDLNRFLSVGCLLIGWFCLAGTWHHWRWNCRAVDDIANSATDQPQIVRLAGKVMQTPWVVQHPERDKAPWQDQAHTVLTLDCRSLKKDTGDRMTVSGMARVSVSGTLSSLALGDTIEVTGELVLPNSPANPGDFDQRAFLRAQGVSAMVRSDHVESVVVVSSERTVWDWVLVLRGVARKRAEQLIEKPVGTGHSTRGTGDAAWKSRPNRRRHSTRLSREWNVAHSGNLGHECGTLVDLALVPQPVDGTISEDVDLDCLDCSPSVRDGDRRKSADRPRDRCGGDRRVWPDGRP